ncbi:alpha/beta fold hydrolase [Vallitalea okinawensis]|uniref:alpha/beta fold hydrolase n=1 Tax=Vallitalea okinawensis TaxID=2078660 RepID=UPI000CFB2EE5|nr:alpha/beta fold hydrolase [Vallitalea okinawensis]
MLQFNFPIGYHEFHKTKIMDFQMNRWYSMGYTRKEDMADAASRINKVDDWKDEMIRQAEKALKEKRLMNATFYYRAAEFFTSPSDPDKIKLYDKFIDMFYNQVFKDEPFQRFPVPYGNVSLPAMKVPPRGNEKKGTIVIHGGFDSFIEEFYSMATYFADLNYEVVLFEGPGQGSALKKQGLALTYEWEKPVKAVLDYFDLDDVTLLGISMGGWLCFRAAAYEPRIKRVIASSIAYDYMKIPPESIEKFARWLFKHPKLMAWMSDLKMKMMPQEKWGVENLMYITKTDTPLDSGMAILEFNEEHLKSELVKQDVLILTGAEDHFIPLKMHDLQVKALKNTKSITEHVFTRAEHAQNHCQIGNLGLSLETMSKWIVEKES